MPIRQALEIVKKHLVENAKSKTQEHFINKKKEVKVKTCMENEIFEQPESIRRALNGRVDFELKRVNLPEIESFVPDILRCKRLIVIGAASSHHVAIGTRQIIEEMVELPVFVELASDFLDRQVPIFRDDMCIFISQSGETSSIVQACQYCKHRDAMTMGITNGEMCTLNTMTDFSIDIRAGEEKGITSTKSYTSQSITMILFALKLAADKKTKLERIKNIISELQQLPGNIEKVLLKNENVRELARGMISKESVLVMGRGYQQASCLEGSFKLKEVANIHSEGIHSGELKHGPLALIDDKIPIVMIIMRDAIFDKCMNALQQVRAREGKPILICEAGDNEILKMSEQTIEIPKTVDCLQSVLTVIPLQLMAFHLANFLNKNVDHPAGLVKTVIDKCELIEAVIPSM